MAGSARTVGDRIEELLASFRPGHDQQTAEELVRLLVEMYGDALGRVVAVLTERDPALVERLTGDDLVNSLLVLHDLHPLDVDTRIQRALDGVRPYLGSHAGGVEYLGVDDQGVARLRLEGNCHGCPSSTVTVRTAIEGAILGAAPEVIAVDVAGVTEPEPAPLLQVGMGPPPDWTAGTAPATEQPASGWSVLPAMGPPTGRPQVVEVDGARVLVCSIRGTLYAYLDRCAGCATSLADAELNGNVLTCTSCGSRFNVRLAGRGLEDTTRHLDPLPLLSDSQGTRVVVPRAVA